MTAAPMGRLTLNVLLSFAQFEREVTAERIRDKIAASKKKGIWMGGVPPLGYDVANRQLVINPNEAEMVRAIFAAYLEVGTVRKLSQRVDELGFRTKSWTNQSGNRVHGVAFSRGRLYHLLSNPIYIGRIVHKDTTYEGRHRAIIPSSLWSLVQDRLKAQWGERKTEKNRKSPCWLVGILKDEAGIFACIVPPDVGTGLRHSIAIHLPSRGVIISLARSRRRLAVASQQTASQPPHLKGFQIDSTLNGLEAKRSTENLRHFAQIWLSPSALSSRPICT